MGNSNFLYVTMGEVLWRVHLQEELKNRSTLPHDDLNPVHVMRTNVRWDTEK